MDRISEEILRCQDEWYSLLEPLEDLKYCSVALADGNVRRIRLPAQVHPSCLIQEVESFVEKRKAKLEDLRYWTIHPSYRNEQLERFLLSNGFKFNLEIGMVLGRTISLVTNPHVEIEGGSELPQDWEQVQIVLYTHDPDVVPSEIPRLVERNRRRFSDSRVEMYVAKLDAQPTGMMALFTSQSTCQIDEVYTIPQFRKQHVASTLMAALIDAARKRGAENVIISAPGTFASLNIYRKMGFREKIELAGYYR
jgi:GNAT superfamily N-acetyltransferase